MKSFDTNVLVRFFIDDQDDSEAARQRPIATLALAERGFVAITVVLEFEWVMRGFYQLPRAQISQVLKALAGIQHITLEDRAQVLSALGAYELGLDFADALHHARSGRASGLVTFDKRLARKAKALGLSPGVELLT